jgi:RNA polymerase sigma factor (sigma-70 family)
VESRDEAIIGLMSLVVGIAHKVHRQVPEFPVDDLISEGWIGAMFAVDRYDPERGATLATYAATRIRGQMMDHIRSYSWLSRRDYVHVQEGTKALSMRSLDEPTHGDVEDAKTLADLLPDDEDAVARMIDQIAIRTVIAQLSEKHRSILVAYYYDGLTLSQIAELDNVTDSRISQRLRAAREAAYRQLEQ